MQISDSTAKPNALYFNKAKRYYRIGFYAFLWVMLFPQFIKLLPDYPIIALLSSVLLLIPALAEFVLVPMAVINIIKSFWHKEPYNKYRMFYFIVLIAIQAVLILMIVSILGDLRSL
jgi:hypothetical protein